MSTIHSYVLIRKVAVKKKEVMPRHYCETCRMVTQHIVAGKWDWEQHICTLCNSMKEYKTR